MDETTETSNLPESVERTDDFVADKPNETEKNGNEYQEFPGGPFKEGNPGGGREKEDDEEKEARRIRKEVNEKIKEEYKNGIIQQLPKISPALMAKAEAGDVQAIKEIHSLIFGNKTVMVGGDKDDPTFTVNIIRNGNYNPS